MHIMKDKNGSRSVKCVFFGYLEGDKGYNLWKVEFRGLKFIIIRYVTEIMFLGNKCWTNCLG